MDTLGHTVSNGKPEETMASLTHIPTSITLSAEQFEKLYLSPLTHRQGTLSKQMGNPTPLALCGFILTTTPLSCSLMGWRGAGGGGIALTGPFIFIGGLLLLLGGLLEFLVGNTYPCVVFGVFGTFWLALASNMMPAFNAAAPYSASTTDTVAGLGSPGYLNTFAFFLIGMAALMVIFLICATRTNIVYVGVFASLIVVFSLLAGGYWRLGVGDAVVGNRMIVGAGATLFFTSLLGFYLVVAQLFASVGLPIRVPVGDLSSYWDRVKVERDIEYAAEK